MDLETARVVVLLQLFHSVRWYSDEYVVCFFGFRCSEVYDVVGAFVPPCCPCWPREMKFPRDRCRPSSILSRFVVRFVSFCTR